LKKLIINLAPTGMVPTKQDNVHLPVSPEEIIADVLSCAEIGVSMAHLHVRDANGLPAYQKEIYAEIIAGIREKRPELVIVVSTSGRNFSEVEKRADVLKLAGKNKPDMASLTLGSLNFMKTASVNDPDTIVELAKIMKANGIKPELEIFDLGMVNYAKTLIQKGIIEPPFYFNIILGNIASAQATLQHAGLILADLPADSICSLTGIGSYQLPMHILAMAVTDGVRIGLEDNIWFDAERKIRGTNYMLVERITKIATACGRQIADPGEVRSRLGLA